ncbi:hypothetical protein GOODEAATRI_018770, partial [Goodea atripinnis]
LHAAQSFIDRHSERLEQLDLAILLNFDPLKEMILEKLDTKPEFFSSLGLTCIYFQKYLLTCLDVPFLIQRVHYFAQILEEHGPLMEEDPLLVGELQHFPHEARKMIAEAGGLETFLLESLRFIKIGRYIGLTHHAVSLQQDRHRASLDDLDEIVDAHHNSISPDLYTGLYGLYRELADAKALLSKLDEAAHRTPSQELETKRSGCKAKVEEVEKSISTVELFAAQAAHGASPPAAAEAPAAPLPKLHKPAARKPEPLHVTVFEKAMESLTAMPDLTRFVQEFRLSRGGSLNSMPLQEVVGGVTQLILDHQEKLNTARANIVGRSSPAQGATPPLATHNPVWQRVGTQRVRTPNALNMEDPCIICHEDMGPEDTCVLECRHSFHNEVKAVMAEGAEYLSHLQKLRAATR